MEGHRTARTAVALIGALVCGGVAAAANGPEPLYVDLRLHGGMVPGCEGGDWELQWRGEVPASDGSLEELLTSYSSFDTSHFEGRNYPAPHLKATPVVCRNREGEVESRASLTSGGERDIRVLLDLASPLFSFSVGEIANCRLVIAGTGIDIPHSVVIDSRAFAPFSPNIAISREELQEGFHKRFTIGSGPVGMSSCTGKLTGGELTLRYKSGPVEPRVKLAGCADLTRGESTTVTATADPGGGRFRYWTEPKPPLSVSGSGSTVSVTAGEPGRTRIHVEYTLDGESARDALEGSTVELVSVNGGQPIPKIGLYGIDGKPTHKVYRFPLVVAPADGTKLLQFAVEEPLASVVAGSGILGIQGVREGQTVIRAKSLCGTPVDPAIPITVVPCDDAVIAELNRKKEELIRRERNIVKRQTDLTSDPEFDRAAREIAKHTEELALKASELIMFYAAAASAKAAKTPGALAEAGLNAAAIEGVSFIWDTVGAVEAINRGDYQGAAVGMEFMAAGAQFSKLPGLKTAKEAWDASNAFGMDLGTLVGIAQELEALEKQHDAIRRELNALWEPLKKCKQPPPPPTEGKRRPPRKRDPLPDREPPPDKVPEEPSVPEPPSEPPPVEPSPSLPPEENPGDPERTPSETPGLPIAPGSLSTRELLEEVQRQYGLLNNNLIAGQQAFERFSRLVAEGIRATQLPPGPMQEAFRRIGAEMEQVLETFRELAAEGRPIVETLGGYREPLVEETQELRMYAN